MIPILADTCHLTVLRPSIVSGPTCLQSSNLPESICPADFAKSAHGPPPGPFSLRINQVDKLLLAVRNQCVIPAEVR